MEFSRTKLLTMIETGLKNHRAAYDASVRAQAESHAKEAEVWEKSYGSDWDAFVKKLGDVRKKKQPVTDCMFPKQRDRYHCGSTATFTPSRDKIKPYEQPEDLLTLKALLEACTSDTISLAKIKLSNIETIAQGAIRRR